MDQRDFRIMYLPNQTKIREESRRRQKAQQKIKTATKKPEESDAPSSHINDTEQNEEPQSVDLVIKGRCPLTSDVMSARITTLHYSITFNFFSKPA